MKAYKTGYCFLCAHNRETIENRKLFPTCSCILLSEPMFSKQISELRITVYQSSFKKKKLKRETNKPLGIFLFLFPSTTQTRNKKKNETSIGCNH